jgi:heme/copper-type cytochrome/quinol oxidase subunit 2
MDKSLSSFMMMAAIVIIMVTLVLGVVFAELKEVNELHEDMLQTEHQVKFK